LKFQSRPGSTGSELVLVDSFISYGASGVVVGQVPEGGALAMVLAGLGAMGGMGRSGRLGRLITPRKQLSA
jgi:hypothetical protein